MGPAPLPPVRLSWAAATSAAAAEVAGEGGGGLVHAQLCHDPAEICRMNLSESSGITLGSSSHSVPSSPSCPKLFLPQPQTSPRLLSARVWLDPADMSTIFTEASAGTWKGESKAFESHNLSLK